MGIPYWKSKAGLYPYPKAYRYFLTRNGVFQMAGTEQECWNFIHNATACSVERALTSEGWKMEPDKGVGA
jgi:hypothetical protein